MRRNWPALLLLLLSACGSSPPTHYYTLTADPAANPRYGSVHHRGTPVVVGHVTLPGDLDRDSLVTRIGPNRLNVSDQDRWAGPLDEMIRRILATDLRARLHAATVLAPGDPVPEQGARSIVLAIRQFMGDSTGHVVLEADWTLVSAKGQKPLATRHVRLTEQAGAYTAPGIVAAMSRLLARLADEIADTIGL